jgi:hypothetical protein
VLRIYNLKVAWFGSCNLTNNKPPLKKEINITTHKFQPTNELYVLGKISCLVSAQVLACNFQRMKQIHKSAKIDPPL